MNNQLDSELAFNTLRLQFNKITLFEVELFLDIYKTGDACFAELYSRLCLRKGIASKQLSLSLNKILGNSHVANWQRFSLIRRKSGCDKSYVLSERGREWIRILNMPRLVRKYENTSLRQEQ